VASSTLANDMASSINDMNIDVASGMAGDVAADMAGEVRLTAQF